LKGADCSEDVSRRVRERKVHGSWSFPGEAAGKQQQCSRFLHPGVCTDGLRAGPRAAFSCGSMAGRKALGH